MQKTGTFIVFEGIDGCGGETQSALLVKKLREQEKLVQQLSYPDYTGPIAQLISDYLYRKHDFSKEVQFLLFFADYLKDKEKISQWLQQGNTVIADRYITSAFAYQCFQGVPLDHALTAAHLFMLPVPNKVLLLDISAETSSTRKEKEKHGDLDHHESNRQLLSDLAAFYKKLARQNTFAPWHVINGEQSIEKVSQDVIQTLS